MAGTQQVSGWSAPGIPVEISKTWLVTGDEHKPGLCSGVVPLHWKRLSVPP